MLMERTCVICSVRIRRPLSRTSRTMGGVDTGLARSRTNTVPAVPQARHPTGTRSGWTRAVRSWRRPAAAQWLRSDSERERYHDEAGGSGRARSARNRGGVRGPRSRPLPRAPGLCLDLPPRRHRRRGDDRPAARSARRARGRLHRSRTPSVVVARALDRTAPRSSCCAWPTAATSSRCSSPTRRP